MTRYALALALIASTTVTRAGAPIVAVRMRHVSMHVGYGASLRIDDSLCPLNDLARLIFLSLRPGAIGRHRRIKL